MATLSRLVPALVVAVFLALLPRPAHAAHHENFPIKADDFREEIEKKIARTKTVIDKKLERAGVSAGRRTEVRHVVDEVSRQVKNALDRATSDNNISRDEARDIRAMAKALRGKVRARLRVERDSRRSGRSTSKSDDAGTKRKKTPTHGGTETTAAPDEER